MCPEVEELAVRPCKSYYKVALCLRIECDLTSAPFEMRLEMRLLGGGVYSI